MRKGRDHGNEMREHMKIISSDLPRDVSRGRNFFQKAHFFTLWPFTIREKLALSSSISLLCGVCNGQ